MRIGDVGVWDIGAERGGTRVIENCDGSIFDLRLSLCN